MYRFTLVRNVVLSLAVYLIASTATLGQVVNFERIELRSTKWKVTIDPDTLGVTAQHKDGTRFVLSEAQPAIEFPIAVMGNQWHVWFGLPGDLSGEAELRGSRLTMRFVSDKPGEITWPVIPDQKHFRGYILPMYEGVYAPTDDADWMEYLVEQGPMDTTASLSMPFVGLDYGGATVTYIFENMFDNVVTFSKDESGGVGVKVTHTFKPNWNKWEYTVVVELGDGSPIEPAKKYRDYLIERGEFVTMAEKIEANPRAERLLGAPHTYLWDAGVFSQLDATDWKAFCAKLIEEGEAEADTLGKRIWGSFNEEGREAAVQITLEEWPYKYLKSVVAAQVSAYLETSIEALDNKHPRMAMLNTFCEHFEGLVLPYNQWGDGISTKLLDEFQAAGLERMNLCLGGLSDADMKPQVARHADKLGYLFGPYDSYHSIHRPDAHPDSTWETAQFGWELYNSGGIVKEDGTMSAGFKKVGYHLSPKAARPYIEERVHTVLGQVPFNSIFIDCDAYGQFFDDYSLDHPATKQQDMLERLDRLQWLAQENGLVVGSEGGSAYAAPAIHFAHGTLTPVIGWGDTDFKDKQSPYYKGAYWPPDGPTTFTMPVPLKPRYKKFYYDPRYRLPLYQVVFHDSVIATHHWGNASLKFMDVVGTVALLEQLYNVPPLYHLNHAEFKKHREHILNHYAFFSPLHRDLALQPMTGFKWLTEDRLVQQTTFGDDTRITANFSAETVSVDSYDLPANSVMAVRPGSEPVYYHTRPGAE